MSNNTSTESGWLTPTNSDPVYDDALDQLLSEWICNVSGLSAEQVGTRWTKDNLPILSAENNGCMFGITGCSAEGSPVFTCQTDEDTQFWRHERLECMASFYGPEGMSFAARFRDGTAVPQNNAELNGRGLVLENCSGLTLFSELINQQWVRRYDMTIHLRRKVIRKFGIKSLVEAPVTFLGE